MFLIWSINSPDSSRVGWRVPQIVISPIDQWARRSKGRAKYHNELNGTLCTFLVLFLAVSRRSIVQGEAIYKSR